MTAKKRNRPKVPCPHCGEYISADSVSCPECGSDRQTGWANEEEIAYQQVVLPEKDIDVEKAITGSPSTKPWMRRGALLGLIAMAALTGLIGVLLVVLSRGC